MASSGPQITLHIAHRLDFAYHLSYTAPGISSHVPHASHNTSLLHLVFNVLSPIISFLHLFHLLTAQSSYHFLLKSLQRSQSYNFLLKSLQRAQSYHFLLASLQRAQSFHFLLAFRQRAQSSYQFLLKSLQRAQSYHSFLHLFNVLSPIISSCISSTCSVLSVPS